MPVIGYLVGCWIGKSAGFESRPFAELRTKRYDMRAMMVRYGRVLGNSNHDPLDLIEADLIPPAIVELCRARRGVVRHRRGLFQRAAVLEVGGDPCCPTTVGAEFGGDAGRRGAPADHRIGVRLRQLGPGK